MDFDTDDFGGRAERDCAASGIAVRRMLVAFASEQDWMVSLEVGDRIFHYGYEARQGFFCWEAVGGGWNNLVPAEWAGLSGRSAILQKRALTFVREAVEAGTKPSR